MQRQSVSNNTPWERAVGYSRAVRVGSHIYVSGTTASDESGDALFPGDAYRQTKCVLEKISDALAQLGGGMGDVVRTRMFVTDIENWQDIGKAHGEVFGEIRPAATMVEIRRLVDPNHLVEIEVDAFITESTH